MRTRSISPAVTNVDFVVAFGNTAAKEGGGFWNAGTMTINGSFLGFNNAPTGQDVFNNSGTLNFNGRNIPAKSGA